MVVSMGIVKPYKKPQRRLMPWIISRLNEPCYPSLRWHDSNKMIFRVAWPHKSANHWAEESTRFLKDWASYKGKLQPGKEIDYKKLKSNFRCALNSKRELREVMELRSKKFRYWQIKKNSNHSKQDTTTRRKVKTKLSCMRELRQKKSTNLENKAISAKNVNDVQTKTHTKERCVEESSFSRLPSFVTFCQPHPEENILQSAVPNQFENIKSPTVVSKDHETPNNPTDLASTLRPNDVVNGSSHTYQDDIVFGDEDLEFLEWLICNNSTLTCSELLHGESMDCSDNYTNNSIINIGSSNVRNENANSASNCSASSVSNCSTNSMSNCSTSSGSNCSSTNATSMSSDDDYNYEVLSAQSSSTYNSFDNCTYKHNSYYDENILSIFDDCLQRSLYS